MPVVQRQALANYVSYTGSGTISSNISTLRSKISSGNIIYASDINLLVTLINNWLGHYHNYYDGIQTGDPAVGGYGNNGDRATYVQERNTAVYTGTTTGVSSGNIITASKHQDLRNWCVLLGSHNHNITDVYSF